MKIIIAKNIGFCSGVKRAIALTEKTIKEGVRPVQFLGELVHNENVLDYFLEKGVGFTKKLKPTIGGTLIIQAHGRPPLPFLPKTTVRDATCPLVKRAQMAASSFHKQGYQVIILGDAKHSEVIGIRGYTDNQALVVKNEKEANDLPRFKEAALIAQTTQNQERFNKALKALKKKVKILTSANTICPEVAARQKEIKEIIKKCDAILVIGSRLSANTKRLAEKVKQSKKKLIWVNSLTELKNKMLKLKARRTKIKKLGVISGTSTPDWEIDKIKQYLKNYEKKNQGN